MTTISMIKEQIIALQDKIHLIQKYCSHPEQCVTKIARSSTGGYDGPSSDQYWKDCECGLCEKKWTEDQ